MKYKIRPNVKILQRRGINHFFAEVEANIAESAGKMFDEAGIGYWEYEPGDYMITAPPNAITVMKSFYFEAAYEPADPLPDPLRQALLTIRLMIEHIHFEQDKGELLDEIDGIAEDALLGTKN